MEKGKQTRLELYGDEFYSNNEKAQQTMLEKYGVTSYMYTKEFNQKKLSVETRQKAIETKRKNNTFHVSSEEAELRKILIHHFGSNNVYSEYQDKRYYNKNTGYQFKCDFYIKSKDLFIELNYFPTHMLHPFCEYNEEDVHTLSLLKSNDTKWNRVCIDVWTIRDPMKLNIAKENNLNYIMLYPKDDYTDIINIIKECNY